MAKEFEHWCDKQHQEPSDDNKFVIGDMAEKIFNDLEQYLLHDINKDLKLNFDDSEQDKISKNYVVKRMYSILDNAEKLELYVKDANSIYGYYDVDFKMRRERWLTARGLCFKLIAQLRHISSITIKGTNLQKYVGISSRIYKLSFKIKNAMMADDKRKKKGCKKYLE